MAASPSTRRTGGLAAALVILMGLLGHFEGTRYTAYRDIAGVLTICTGETHGVYEGQHATVEECKDMTTMEALKSLWAVDEMLIFHPAPHRWAALADFEYNLGRGAFKNSSILNDLNMGDTTKACNDLLKYNKVRVHGVLKFNKWQDTRRHIERDLCLRED